MLMIYFLKRSIFLNNVDLFSDQNREIVLLWIQAKHSLEAVR